MRAAKSRARRPRRTDAQLIRALRAELTRAWLGQVGVRLRAGKVDLTGIPGTKLTAAGRALVATKPPDPD